MVAGLGSLMGAATMTGRIQSEKTPRERFLEAALKELEKFERRENDFLKKERQDRAVELNLYLDNSHRGGLDVYFSPEPALKSHLR
jgi:hypothetical protein